MKVVIAPDKFKGSLSAAHVADAVAMGLLRAQRNIEIDRCPVADGGEGTVEAIVAATGGRLETRRVTGPLPDMKVDAAFSIIDDGAAAIVEMSAASGLALLSPSDRDPFHTTTFGTGELLIEAAKLGVRHILLAIGGSATVDGGIGCAQACGQPVILDEIGPADVHEPLIGEDLRRVVLVKHARGSPLDRVRITVLCDVTNPLYGPNGAARVFGPQKGATLGQIEELDTLLRRLAERCGKTAEANAPGAGAAGGMGFAMLAFFGATLRPGFEMVAEAVHLRDRLRNADWCITGEGRLDRSSFQGKAAGGVAKLCRELGVRCSAIVGSLADEFAAHEAALFDKIAPLQLRGMSVDDCMRDAARLIAERAEGLVHV